MNKEQYLRKLRSLIRKLPKSEQKTVIEYYREMIDDKVENGQTEEQAVAELGDVFLLAQKILAENPNRKRYSANRIAGIVVASIFAVLIIAGICFNSLRTSSTAAESYGFAWNSQNQNSGRGSEPLETKTEMALAAETKCIYIDVRDKEISVERVEGDSICLTYQSSKQDQFTYTNTNGVMKLINHSQGGFHTFDFFDWDPQSRVTVSVPESYAGEVYLSTSNGTISAENLSHATVLTCSTSNGKVLLSDVQAERISANNSNGRIVFTDVTASKVNADTSNAEISLQKLNAPDIELETSNGGIRGSIVGREEDYTIHTDTSNGSCTPGSRQGGSKRLFADTSNASIRIDFVD
ncbi:DUF4097 family beta strand repeat-containing protein [Caproiciproducens sp. LBM24188]